MDTIAIKVRELADIYGRSRESLLPILQGIVEEQAYLSEDAMVEVAKQLDISAASVYGTASFYSFLSTKPLGKNVIRVCKTITCMMNGKSLILQELEHLLNIKVGETTHDGLITVLETNCLGQCHLGPAILVNDVPYTKVTVEDIRSVVNELRHGKA